MQRTEFPPVGLCVNLCEVAPLSATANDLETLLGITCETAGFPACERVYVGSYFCENYFLGLGGSFHEAVRDLCVRHGLGATLVVPVFGQAFLDRGNRRLAELFCRFGDLYDEVVANDVGVFSDLLLWQPQGGFSFVDYLPRGFPRSRIRVGLGRLFAKERRDARYAEVFESVGHPALSAEAQACLAMQAEHEPGARPLVEVDPTNSVVDVSGLLESAAARAGVGGPATALEPEVAIHLPYCYATTGRNCSPASTDDPDSQKFRLGKGCSFECLRLRESCLTDEGARYVKHGRAHYFANPTCRIAGAPQWRIVYSAM